MLKVYWIKENPFINYLQEIHPSGSTIKAESKGLLKDLSGKLLKESCIS